MIGIAHERSLLCSSMKHWNKELVSFILLFMTLVGESSWPPPRYLFTGVSQKSNCVIDFCLPVNWGKFDILLENLAQFGITITSEPFIGLWQKFTLNLVTLWRTCGSGPSLHSTSEPRTSVKPFGEESSPAWERPHISVQPFWIWRLISVVTWFITLTIVNWVGKQW